MSSATPCGSGLRAAANKPEYLFQRSKRGTFYVRQHVPVDLAGAISGGRKEVVRSLRTADPSVAKSRLHKELCRIETDSLRRGSA